MEWQTRESQKLVGFNARAGSSPATGTMTSCMIQTQSRAPVARQAHNLEAARSIRASANEGAGVNPGPLLTSLED